MKVLCKKPHNNLYNSLRNGLHKKLHNSKGETLVEVLVSILICTISVALLFSGIMAAANINRKAEISDKDFFTVLNSAEQKKEGTQYETGTIYVQKQGGIGVPFTVSYYGNGTIRSYKSDPETKAGGDSGL